MLLTYCMLFMFAIYLTFGAAGLAFGTPGLEVCAVVWTAVAFLVSLKEAYDAYNDPDNRRKGVARWIVAAAYVPGFTLLTVPVGILSPAILAGLIVLGHVEIAIQARQARKAA